MPRELAWGAGPSSNPPKIADLLVLVCFSATPYICLCERYIPSERREQQCVLFCLRRSRSPLSDGGWCPMGLSPGKGMLRASWGVFIG